MIGDLSVGRATTLLAQKGVDRPVWGIRQLKRVEPVKTSKTKLYKQTAARRAKFNGSTLKMNQVLNKQGFTNYEPRGFAKGI